MATALVIIHGLVAVALLGRRHPPDTVDMGAGARPVIAIYTQSSIGCSAASCAKDTG